MMKDRSASTATSPSTVATVSGSGWASGIAVGNTVITASSNGVVSNQSFLQITPNGGTPSSLGNDPAAIEVSPPSASIAEGSGQQFAAVIKDANGSQLSGIDLAWLSSNTDVALIDADGMANAVSSGTTEIFAMNGPVASNRITLQVVRAQQSYQIGGGGCGFIRMKGGRLPDTRQIATNLVILFAPLLFRAVYKRGRQIIRMKKEDWLELFGVWNGLRVATVSLGVFLFAVMTQEVLTFISTAI